MADYCADSSVLIKRHVRETGSDWVQALCDMASGNVIVTARISMVEVYSAFDRRRREAGIADIDCADMIRDFTVCADGYPFVKLMPNVVDRARLLLERYPLRAYDAVQYTKQTTSYHSNL
jgi:predicted nucleic acid-binding protein